MEITPTTTPTKVWIAYGQKAMHNRFYQHTPYSQGVDAIVVCTTEAQAKAVLNYWIDRMPEVVEHTQEDLQSIYEEQDKDQFPTLEAFLKHHYPSGPGYYHAASGHFIGKRGDDKHDFADSFNAISEGEVWLDEDGDVAIKIGHASPKYVEPEDFKWLNVGYIIGFSEARALAEPQTV